VKSTLFAFSFATAQSISSVCAIASVDPNCITYIEGAFEATYDDCEDSVCGFNLRVRAIDDENTLTGVTLILGSEEDPLVISPLRMTNTENGFVDTGFFVSESLLSELQVLGFYGIRDGCQLRAKFDVT